MNQPTDVNVEFVLGLNESQTSAWVQLTQIDYLCIDDVNVHKVLVIGQSESGSEVLLFT
jgi:hypothetical protein